jgi:hypothetical protein
VTACVRGPVYPLRAPSQSDGLCHERIARRAVTSCVGSNGEMVEPAIVNHQ